MAVPAIGGERVIVERLVVGQFRWEGGRSYPLWAREEVDAVQAEKIRSQIAEAKNKMQMPQVRIVGPVTPGTTVVG
jgi:hypothetical protein